MATFSDRAVTAGCNLVFVWLVTCFCMVVFVWLVTSGSEDVLVLCASALVSLLLLKATPLLRPVKRLPSAFFLARSRYAGTSGAPFSSCARMCDDIGNVGRQFMTHEMPITNASVPKNVVEQAPEQRQNRIPNCNGLRTNFTTSNQIYAPKYKIVVVI